MNEKDINILLDHFVGGLDSAELSSVTEKINTLPMWSKTYDQLKRVFGSLNTLKEQNKQQAAPEGLANKTFQKILENLESEKVQSQSEIFAQKASDSLQQPVHFSSRKRFVSVKPSFLAFSACAGFLFVVVIAFSTQFWGGSNINPVSSDAYVNSNSSFNNLSSSDAQSAFAVTGAKQSASSLFFCSNSTSNAADQNIVSNSVGNLAVNSSEQLVDLTGATVPEQRETSVKMACPDSFVVLSSQPNGHPIIVVPQHHLPGELQNVQDVFSQPNANFVVPVNYQK